MTKIIARSCVLIHGGWHGGWVWDSIIEPIKKIARYEKVIAPDLPGHGNNKLDFKNVTLNSYTDSIFNIINPIPKPVALIGHSMGGMIISKVAEYIPSDIAYLIYLSGFIPDNAGSLVDEEKKSVKPSVALAATINLQNYAIKIDNQKAPYLFYNCSNTEYVKYAMNKLQDQLLLPFVSPVSISQDKFGSVKKFYIACLQDNAIHPIDQKRMYSKVDCQVLTLDTDHSPFFSAQENLIELIGMCANAI